MKTNQLQKNNLGDWQSLTLGEVGKVSMCKRIMKNQTLPSGDIPFFKIGTFGKEPDAFINKKLYLEFKEKYSFPKKGEILISASGTIGRTVVYDGSSAYFQDSNIIWLSNNEKLVLNPFLLYSYDLVKWEVASGTIPRLYNDNVRNIKINTPPLPEQNRIVSVLETWDMMIEKLARKIEAKKQIKKGLMQDLLTGKKRLKGFSDKWVVVKLSEVGQFSKGLGVLKDEITETGRNVIRYGELYTKYDFVIENVFSHIPQSVISSTKKIKYGDILFAGSGETIDEIGKSAAYLLEEECYAGGDTIIFSPTNADSLFLAYFLNTGEARKGLRELGQGQSVVHLYKSDMEKLSFKLPIKNEQIVISKIILAANREIQGLEKKLSIIKEQKRYLLNNLITGTIRTPETLSTKLHSTGYKN